MSTTCISSSIQVLGIVTTYSIYICDSYNRTITNSVVYGCKAVLQVMALIFAFSIRKVNIKGLDDSPFIIAAIYVSSIVLAVILVSFITLKDFENVFAVVYCTGFFIGATAMLLLIFVPKVLFPGELHLCLSYLHNTEHEIPLTDPEGFPQLPFKPPSLFCAHLLLLKPPSHAHALQSHLTSNRANLDTRGEKRAYN